MNCKEANLLIDGYIDGELDLVRSMEVEGHLEDCGSCHQAVKSRKELSNAIRSASLRFDAPRRLENRVLAAVRKESKQNASRPQARWRRLFVSSNLAFGAAGVVLAILVGWSLFRLNSGSSAQHLLAEEVVSSHIRSLQAGHLFDVASTDQHTVKPWFNGRLDYSPPVVDLVDKGFPLTGGRLDYIQGRPVAALVYRHRLHVINLFIWPSSRGAAESHSGSTTESLRGYHTVSWSRDGMVYEAVSDVNFGDLKEFTNLFMDRAGH